MRRTSGSLLARAAAALSLAGLAVVGATPATAQPVISGQPGVINGTPGSPLAGAAVSLRMGNFGWCTGTLWQPQIIITAAHCFVDGGRTANAVRPNEVVVYPPGADQRNGRSKAKVTHVIYDREWVPFTSSADGSQLMPVEQDIAYLVLDRPIGQPVWARMATAEEVAQLAASGTAAEYIGYGLTVPKADNTANPSPVPLSLRVVLDPRYNVQGSYYSIGDGVAGNCSGDSGGPLMAQLGAELLYIGPVTRVSGPPCIPQSSSAVGSSGMIASARPDLMQRAQEIVQASQASMTCIVGPEVERECWDGSVWSYAYCWSGRKAALQRMDEGQWVTVARIRAKRSVTCDGSYPYLLSFTRSAEGPNVEYQVYVPRQAGIDSAMTDPFTVTAS